jgi:hypothetical protein
MTSDFRSKPDLLGCEILGRIRAIQKLDLAILFNCQSVFNLRRATAPASHRRQVTEEDMGGIQRCGHAIQKRTIDALY